MSTLAPTLEGGIGFDRPIAEPSALAGVASLASGFVSATAPPKPASAASRLANDKAGFYTQLQRGQALIEQGQGARGERIITQAYRGFSGRYGLEHDDVNSAFSNSTGISFDVEVTGDVVRESDIAATPEFNIQAAVVQQQNPDADPQQVYDISLERETARLATDLRIQQHEKQEVINWIDIEADYVDKARQTNSLIRGMLASARVDAITTVEEARDIRKFYMDMYGGITKPIGVDKSSWDDYQEEYLQPTTAFVEGMIGLTRTTGISQDMNRALDDIIKKAGAQGKIPASLLVKTQGDSTGAYDSFMTLLQQASKDPKYAKNYNHLMNSSYEELLNWVTEFESKVSTDELKIDTLEFDSQSGEDKRQSLLTGAQINPGSGPEQIAVDLLNTNAKLLSTETRALQPGDFAAVFNPNYFRSVEAVFQANPVIGRQIAQDAVQATLSQQTAIGLAMTAEARQLGFKIVGGKLLPEQDYMPASVKGWVDLNYGGDWELAVQANQDNATSLAVSSISGKTQSSAAVQQFINKAQRSTQPRLDKLRGASAAIDQLTKQFLTEDVTGIPEVTGGDGDSELDGSAGADTLTPTFTSARDLIRSKEGFRTNAYWDVNHWRAGFGSDTTTRADGTVETVTEDTVVTEADAERDLARREQEFITAARRRVGESKWDNLPGNVQTALTSIAYNYGSVPKRLIASIQSGDIESIAVAVEGLAGDNDGVNRSRRMEEAAIIRGKATPSQPPVSAFSTPPPSRPEGLVTPAPQPTSPTPTAGVRPQERPVQEGQEAPSSEAPREVVKRTPEEAQQVWGVLSAQTQATLARLFGNSEGALEAIKNGLDQEDIDIIERGAKQ